MSRHKICESCGMPMGKPEDFGGGNTKNRYCLYCADSSGKLKSYEEVLSGMADFMVKTQGIPKEDALKKAKAHMGKMPAWKGKE